MTEYLQTKQSDVWVKLDGRRQQPLAVAPYAYH